MGSFKGAKIHIDPSIKINFFACKAKIERDDEWGFVLASLRPLSPRQIRLDVPTRYLSAELLPTLFIWPKDLAARPTPVNRLDNQVLVQLYEHGYKQYNH